MYDIHGMSLLVPVFQMTNLPHWDALAGSLSLSPSLSL